MRKPKRTLNIFEDELRQLNEAASVRRGKTRKGYAPSAFADLFEYSQPRRNQRGAGDVRVINADGEVRTVPADQVGRVFAHVRAPKHKQYNLSYDRKDVADER